MSLIKDLKDQIQNERVSFHMPGHKYKPLHDLNWHQIDTTEIPGTDSLYQAEGILLRAMHKAQMVYGSLATRFLVNGSTGGLLAAILGTTKPDETILIARDSHQSVFNACELGKINFQTMMPILDESGVPLGYDVKQIIQKLNASPDLKTVVLTSPNYFGYTTDVSDLAILIKQRGGTLIVDEAHGAHLPFCEHLPSSALHQGADIVVHSAHKTLPAMTQTAMVHFNCNEDKIEQVDRKIKQLQTSSPSYVLMASIDHAIHWMDNNRQALDELIQGVMDLRLNPLKAWLQGVKPPDDVTKLWLHTYPMGYTGYEVQAHFIQHGIVPEFAMAHGVLLYGGAFQSLKDYDLLMECLALLDKRKASTLRPVHYTSFHLKSIPFWEVSTCQKTLCPIDQAVGAITSQKLVPYPPGVPLALPGDVLDSSCIESIQGLLASGHQVLGVCDGKIEIIKRDEACYGRIDYNRSE